MVGGEGKDFDELGGAEVVADAGGILRVGSLGGAEDVGVEVVGGGEVVRVDAHVGDAGDGGARLLGEGGEGREAECGEERESDFMGWATVLIRARTVYGRTREVWQGGLVGIGGGGEGGG